MGSSVVLTPPCCSSFSFPSLSPSLSHFVPPSPFLFLFSLSLPLPVSLSLSSLSGSSLAFFLSPCSSVFLSVFFHVASLHSLRVNSNPLCRDAIRDNILQFSASAQKQFLFYDASLWYLISSNIHRAHGVVVSHPLSMREALGSIPSVSICHFHGSLPLAMPPSGHGKCTTRCFACAGSRSVSTSSDVRWGMLCESSLSVVAGTCVMHLSSSLFPGGHDEVGACGARGSG